MKKYFEDTRELKVCLLMMTLCLSPAVGGSAVLLGLIYLFKNYPDVKYVFLFIGIIGFCAFFTYKAYKIRNNRFLAWVYMFLAIISGMVILMVLMKILFFILSLPHIMYAFSFVLNFADKIISLLF